MKKCISIFFGLILISVNLISQIRNREDSLPEKPILKFNVLYGLFDFVKPHKEVTYDFKSLTIKFDSLNNIIVEAGNGGKCKYYLSDSNKISFNNCMFTSSSIVCTTKSGYKYSVDLFLDSLFVCNKYVEVDNEIKFFKDSVYKFAVKPYYELLPFPIHKKCLKSFVEETGVGLANLKNDFALINSKFQKEHLGITSKEIDFSKKSLVIVECKSISENKDKRFKNISKRFPTGKNGSFFPVSYAKVVKDPLSCKIYLDIVYTYTRAYWPDRVRSGRYSGFIIDKVDADKLVINITYIE